MPSSPVQLLTEFLAHTSDAAVITSLVTPDVTWVSLSFDDPDLTRIMPWCGPFAGPRAIIETFAEVRRYWRILEFKPMHVFGDDRHAAAFGSFTYESSFLRKRVTSPFAVFLLAEAGRITYMQFMEDTFATAASFQESGRARYRSNPNGDVVELSMSPKG
ncbi:MAG TPA: nuclear transport factor 2 family protein [Gemmatimonadaceae bacterium]|nr:nuclear transport factor 2 family protein [Gemmatimonadaceae bacterium]